MQTFVPFPSFWESANALDMKRLGKQRVETFQVIGGLTRSKLITSDVVGTRMARRRIKTKDGETGWVQKEVPVVRDRPMSDWEIIPRVTANGRTWGDHVIGKMWLGHEYALLDYQLATVTVWTERGGKNDTCLPKSQYLLRHTIEQTDANSTLPDWVGREDVHASHRAALLFKEYEYYSQHGWDEEPKYDYVWPV